MKDKFNFWDEICGTLPFRRLGLKKITPYSLEVFDTWYFNHYPYLKNYFSKDSLKDQRVLEIGLGFGSVGECLALNSKEYTGVDLAANPVKLMQKRIQFKKIKNAIAQNENAVNLTFKDNSFDFIVSIGCLHHTPNLSSSINEVYRVLKPGGQAVIMIYAKYSITSLLLPFFYIIDLIKNGFSLNKIKSFRRFAYDSNLKGNAAPKTVFTSKKELKIFTSKFESIKFCRENYWFPFLRKKGFFLNNCLIQTFGNDWYLILKK